MKWALSEYRKILENRVKLARIRFLGCVISEAATRFVIAIYAAYIIPGRELLVAL
jgi:hypothetical protein